MDSVVTRSAFIGREKEIAQFQQWLTTSDPAAPWILSIHDAVEAPEKKGGVGKTWLLKQFATIARQMYPDIVVVSIDFFNVADREGVVVADRVVDELHAAYPDWSHALFSSVLGEYRDALRAGKEEATEIRDRLTDALIQDLHQLDEQLVEERKYLLLLFDTYELVEQNPTVAVMRLSQAFPENYQFERLGVVIAGRNALDLEHPNWRGRGHEVQELALSPFTQEEMLEYFDRFSTVNALLPEQASALYERTEGRPILLGLVNDVLKRNIMTLENLVAVPKAQFEATLVTKINNLEQPIDTIVLFMAHTPHRFNLAMLAWVTEKLHLTVLAQKSAPATLQEELLALSFVRRPSSGEDFVLHDEMGPLIMKHCWDVQDPDQRTRRALSQCIAEYYEHELRTVQLEQLRQAYTVELLYHKLYTNLEDGYQFFTRHFRQAINLWLSAFARSLLHEAQKFAHDLPQQYQYDLKHFEAQLLQKEERPKEALDLLHQLEQEADADWLEKHRADLLYEKAVCYQQLSDFPEAIACFNAAKEIEKERGHLSDYALLLNWLGYTYYRQGQLEIALTYYDEAVAIHEQLGNPRAYAGVLNSISTVYRLQGRVEEALRRCKIGWRIRYDLFKQGKVSEVYVAWSLGGIGAIYLHIDDLVSAEGHFREAYDIFQRIGHKKGLATTMNRFGQIALARRDLRSAMEWFQRAYNVSLGVDSNCQINSLNKQGWILVLEHRWDEAVELLNKAIRLAQQVHDDYQQAESLIDLADVLERMGHHEQSQQALSEAEEIGQRYSYNYLLGLAKESQGDIRYSVGDYQAAFDYYAEACRYLAYYNAIKYNKTLRKVVDALLETPTEELPSIIDRLIAYWRSHEMAETQPDLISSCQEVKRLMRV